MGSSFFVHLVCSIVCRGPSLSEKKHYYLKERKKGLFLACWFPPIFEIKKVKELNKLRQEGNHCSQTSDKPASENSICRRTASESSNTSSSRSCFYCSAWAGSSTRSAAWSWATTGSCCRADGYRSRWGYADAAPSDRWSECACRASARRINGRSYGCIRRASGLAVAAWWWTNTLSHSRWAQGENAEKHRCRNLHPGPFLSSSTSSNSFLLPCNDLINSGLLTC